MNNSEEMNSNVVGRNDDADVMGGEDKRDSEGMGGPDKIDSDIMGSESEEDSNLTGSNHDLGEGTLSGANERDSDGMSNQT